MSDFAPIDRHLAMEGPSPGSLEARASLAFKGLAALSAAGVVLAFFPGKTPVASLLAVMFNIAAAALAATYAVEAFGIDRHRRWAMAIVRPLLILVAAVGAFQAAAALGQGRIKIPFDVLLAGWALLGTPDSRPAPRVERRGIALVGVTIPLFGALLFSESLFGWGGIADVHESDLQASLQVDCGPSGAGLPAKITLTYPWSWTRTSPLPSGTDIVVIGWTGADADGHPLYTVDSIPDAAVGIHPGLGGYPSTAVADAIATESTGAFRWGIDLPEQGLQPAQIVLQLRRARESPPAPGPLTVTASYVHVGLWRHDAAKVTCSW